MSAPNFSTRHNTRDIYAFGLYSDYAKQCEEDNEEQTSDGFNCWSEDESSYYEERILEALKEKLPDATVYQPTDRRMKYRREGEIIATVRTYFDFAGVERSVSLDVLALPGYWEGWSVDFEETDQPDDLWMLESELRYYVNDGLACALAPKLQKRIEKTTAELSDRVDDILRGEAAHILRCGGIFSNGEAFYRDIA